jgi:hypothetical protein
VLSNSDRGWFAWSFSSDGQRLAVIHHTLPGKQELSIVTNARAVLTQAAPAALQATTIKNGGEVRFIDDIAWRP